MLQSAAVVLFLLILGDAAAANLALPVPGAALGLFALVLVFAARGGPDRGSEELFDFAAPYFPLFFVPAAVGVVASLEVLVVAWMHVMVAIVLGTGATLLFTGILTQALIRAARSEAPA